MNVNFTILTCVISSHSKLKKKPRMHYFRMNSYWYFDEKVHFWNAFIFQVDIMWMPTLNNVSFCIPVCLKKFFFFFSLRKSISFNKNNLRLQIVYFFFFWLTVILMPQRLQRAARNLTVTVMISVTVIMTAWVTEGDNYPMTIIIWLARVISMVPGLGGHLCFLLPTTG